MNPHVLPSCPLRVVVLMPLRDDWKSAVELIGMLNEPHSPLHYSLDILLIDDNSVQSWRSADFQLQPGTVSAIRVARLRRNLGHQRAIAIGLALIEQADDCDAVIVMDCDGEDTPSGVTRLLQAYVEASVPIAIFAERTRRSESLRFRVFYQMYKLLHLGLTGISVRVGNFSILPLKYLTTIVVMSELWNHYAATVFRSRLPFTMVPIARGTRIAGNSTMNFVALVTHGLSAISVFGDIVGVRLLIASLGISLMAVLCIVVVVMIRLLTEHAIPGWATYTTGTLAIILVQLITIATSFIFLVLSSRTSAGFLPLRDSSYFVDATVDIYRI